MLKSLLIKLWSFRREFAKYFIIGLSAFVLDIGSLYLLKEYAGISPVTAVIVNQIFIINYVFFLNRHWSFEGKGATHKQIVRFYIVAGGNYVFSIIWMWALNREWEINYLIARVANVILAVGWNFLLYKYWVYSVHNSNEPTVA